mmetsp:Transcript_54870/g.164214  ORF Transcript_54870/g.164214 Transcript_54870/m.164214 type:complete len:145 (-) Transcript_54870:92-526(-)
MVSLLAQLFCYCLPCFSLFCKLAVCSQCSRLQQKPASAVAPLRVPYYEEHRWSKTSDGDLLGLPSPSHLFRGFLLCSSLSYGLASCSERRRQRKGKAAFLFFSFFSFLFFEAVKIVCRLPLWLGLGFVLPLFKPAPAPKTDCPK